MTLELTEEAAARANRAFDRVISLAPPTAKLVPLGRHAIAVAAAIVFAALGVVTAFQDDEPQFDRGALACVYLTVAAYAFVRCWIEDARALAKTNRALREALTTAALMASHRELVAIARGDAESAVN